MIRHVKFYTAFIEDCHVTNKGLTLGDVALSPVSQPYTLNTQTPHPQTLEPGPTAQGLKSCCKRKCFAGLFCSFAAKETCERAQLTSQEP